LLRRKKTAEKRAKQKVEQVPRGRGEKLVQGGRGLLGREELGGKRGHYHST